MHPNLLTDFDIGSTKSGHIIGLGGAPARQQAGGVEPHTHGFRTLA